MTDSTPSPRLNGFDFVRIGLMLPVMMIVLASAGYLCQAGLADILYLNGARGDRVMWAWTLANSWPATVISGALLAATFVVALLWVAPPAHRSHLLRTPPPRAARLGLYAISAVWVLLGAAWGGNWALRSLPNWPHFNFRPLVMGLSVWLGGVTPIWLARRAYRAGTSAQGEAQPDDGTQVGRRSRVFDLVRVGLMIPGALLAAAAVEVLVVKYVRMVLYVSGNRSWEHAVYASAFWLASPFMAAAFVAALRSVAPPARRVAVAIGAGSAVVLWGALLVFGSAYPWAGQPGTAGWPLVMGPATWFCGGCALWLGRRAHPASQLV
jgi:hypothetical protein